MGVNFAPNFSPYTGQGSFWFWSQKVLPLVYDDSLSYYEVLCKVVTFLNNVIQDMDTAEANIDALRSTYIELQDYVNHYFDSLDVQEEINNKLDDMAESGTLGEIIEPFITQEMVDEGVTQEKVDIAVEGKIDEAVSEQISEAVGPSVTSWLDDNVTPVGSAVIVDDSLTISGAAADAKVTGDDLRNLNLEMSGITTLEDKTVGVYTGQFNSTKITYWGNGSKRSCRIRCKPNTYYKISKDITTAEFSIAYIKVTPAADVPVFNYKNIGVNTNNYNYLTGDDAMYIVINIGSTSTADATGHIFCKELSVRDMNELSTNVATISGTVTTLDSDFDTLVKDRYGDYYSYNLIEDESALTSGYMGMNGTTGSSTTLQYTDYIPVNPGDVLRYYDAVTGVFEKRSFRFVTAFNANKTVQSSKGAENIGNYTVPEGIYFVICTINAGNTRTNFDISLNTPISEYHSYMEAERAIIENFVTPETEVILDKLLEEKLPLSYIYNQLHQAFPRNKLRLTQGLSETWYYADCATPITKYINIGTGGFHTKESKGFYFACENTGHGNNGYKWYRYTDLLTLFDSDEASHGAGYERIISAENLANCSCLVIGDSTVNSMTQKMLNHFNSKGKTLTLIGTVVDQGDNDNKNEGRSGWSAKDFVTGKSGDPFFNPSTQTFDFDYYMTNNNFDTPDFVVIQLGINDLYNNVSSYEEVWGYIKIMIDSILEYDSSIKIILDLPTAPNSDESTHAIAGFLYQMRVVRYNEYAIAHCKSEYSENNVRYSYVHLVLDPDTDISDRVHPNSGGYLKMSNEVINQINNWQNGN